MITQNYAMKLKNQLVVLAFFTGLLVSCGGGSEESADNTDPNQLTKIEGGKYQGGVLRLNSIEDYTSLFPTAINDVYSTHLAGNVYEGLFRFDQATLETVPALAESFEIDNSKKVYTFKIRKGVKFHDDDCFAGGTGREVTAQDFKYCLDFACSNHESNKWSTLFKDVIVGVNDFQEGKADEVSGIVVKDDYSLQITLEDPLSSSSSSSPMFFFFLPLSPVALSRSLSNNSCLFVATSVFANSVASVCGSRHTSEGPVTKTHNHTRN